MLAFFFEGVGGCLSSFQINNKDSEVHFGKLSSVSVETLWIL